MSLRQECLWEKLTPQRPTAERLSGELRVDVCVVGAGITGLSAALHLLEQGKSVCVLEAHETGHGGSGRNVGLANAGMWIAPDEVESKLGAAVGGKLPAAMGAAPALVFALIDKYAIDCQARREGTLHMAHNARGQADLQSRCEHTGSVVGKAFADSLCRGDAQALPMPLQPLRRVGAARLRSGLYEAAFSLYHAVQCLRVMV